MARSSDDVLADLLDRPAPQAGAAAPTARPATPSADPAPAIDQRPARARRSTGLYERLISSLALLIALGIVAGVWYAGAYFTLAALARWLPAIAGWGLAAWLIPAAITVLETGILIRQARGPAVWALWAAVLAADVATTAIGILDQFAGAAALGLTLQAADPSSWVIVGIVGLGFALAPEPLARQIVRELLR